MSSTTEEKYGFYREKKPGMDILEDACDLHVHTGPTVFERLTDHIEAAEQARDVGLRAIVLKDHHAETASTAALVRKYVPGIETFGGVVLNYAVGGLNPFAVDAAISQGAKVIFMPTTDSANHMRHYEGLGEGGTTYAGMHKTVSGRKMDYRGRKGITILNEKGELVPEIEEIINLVAEAGIAIATCHLSPEESTALVEQARRAGVDKIWITHAEYWLNELAVEKRVELANKGAYIESVYATHLPWARREMADIDDTVAAIKAVGPERCILSSDLGQPFNLAPVEGLRAFYRLLMKRGINEEDVRKMACTNPAKLLGLK